MPSRLEDAREAFKVAKDAYTAVCAAMVAADKAYSLAQDRLKRAENFAARNASDQEKLIEAIEDVKQGRL